VAYKSSNSVTGNSTAPTIAAPASTVAGDMCVLFVSNDYMDSTFTGNWPAGFTPFGSEIRQTNDGQKSAVAWKRLDGTEGGTTWAFTPVYTSSQDWAIGYVIFDGRSLVDPPTVAVTDDTGAYTGAIVVTADGGITCLEGDDLLFIPVLDQYGSGTVTYSALSADLTARETKQQGFTCLYFATKNAQSAGPSGNKVVTATVSNNTRWGAFLVRIPLQVGETTPPTPPTSFTLDNITETTVRLASCTGATDNVGVVSYDVSLDGGATAYQTGISVGGNITGLTKQTNYPDVRVRSRDASANVSSWSTYSANLTTQLSSSQATSRLWASGTPATTGTSWTNPAYASGANNNQRAAATSSTSGASFTIKPTGYGIQAAIGAQPISIDSVDVTVYDYVSNTGRWTTPNTVQLYDGSTAIGTAQNLTRSATTTFSETKSFTGVTWAQLANLAVLLTGTHTTTSSATWNVDAVGIDVHYTITGASGSVTYHDPSALAPTITVWDGTTEKAATVTVWDGITEKAVTIEIAS